MPHIMKRDRKRFYRWARYRGLVIGTMDFYASESTWQEYLLDEEFDELDKAEKEKSNAA